MQKSLSYKISTLAGIAIVMANMIGTGAFTSLGVQDKQAPAISIRESIDEIVFELKKAGFTSFEVKVNLLPYQYITKAK